MDHPPCPDKKSNINRASIGNQWNIHRAPNIYRTSMEHQSFSEHRAKIYRTCIEHLKNISRRSIDHPSCPEHLSNIHGKTIANRWIIHRAANRPDLILYHPDPPPGQSNPQGVLCDCFGLESPLWAALRDFAAQDQEYLAEIPTAAGVTCQVSLFHRIDFHTQYDFKQKMKDHYLANDDEEIVYPLPRGVGYMPFRF